MDAAGCPHPLIGIGLVALGASGMRWNIEVRPDEEPLVLLALLMKPTPPVEFQGEKLVEVLELLERWTEEQLGIVGPDMEAD